MDVLNSLEVVASMRLRVQRSLRDRMCGLVLSSAPGMELRLTMNPHTSASKLRSKVQLAEKREMLS